MIFEEILYFKVNAGHYTPYYYVGDGQRIAFVRVGDESLPATAQKFADDSDSQLGSIRNAQQGQFSISDRDANTPHIKNIRVVTTIEYSLE